MFKLTVSQAKGVSMEVPAKLIDSLAMPRVTEEIKTKSTATTPCVLRVLKIRNFQVDKAVLSTETKIDDNTLSVDINLAEKAASINELVTQVKMDIIGPENRHVQTDTIMDIIPVCAKVEGIIGEGITNYLHGFTVVLTGVDENGRQVAEFGSSHGMLDEKIKFGRPGTPDAKDIILRIRVVIKEGTGMERRGPLAAHEVCDYIIEHIRKVLAAIPEQQAFSTDVFEEVYRPGKPRILIVKEVGGQGAMHEKLLLPKEPGGIHGAKSVIDLGNIPVMLSPNEIKDGAIHSVT